MIYLLHGENDFLRRERMRELVSDLAEKYDAEDLDFAKIRELWAGQTLFAESREIVIFDLSTQTDLWKSLPDLPETDSLIILSESSVDKRTKTYKWLQKNATVEAFEQFGDRDAVKAVDWCVVRAKKKYNFDLPRSSAKMLVDRLGVEMGRLDQVLFQLEVVDNFDEDFIEKLVPLPKSENTFELLDAAINGRRGEVAKIISYMESTSGDDGAYLTLGLLGSQVATLAGLIVSGASSDRVAKDLGVHPFSAKKLASLTRKVDRGRLRELLNSLIEADKFMKTTSTPPWLLIEMALVK